MSGVSKDWVLSQLAGMRFPEQGQAYDFMKKLFESDPSPNGNYMSEKIGPAVHAVFDKYHHLSQADIQARVCSALCAMPGEVNDIYQGVKTYLRENVGILFGAEQHQGDPDYNYRERRFWRLPIAQRQDSL
jgi:hypothetical protein